MVRDELVQKVVEAVLAELTRSRGTPDPAPAPAESAPAGGGCIPASVRALVAEQAAQGAAAGTAMAGKGCKIPADAQGCNCHCETEDDFLDDICAYDLRERTFIDNPCDPEALKRLKASTPARIGIGRAGPRYRTIPYLRFRADHAAAEDAVMGEVSPELIERMGWLPLQSTATSKEDFLAFPDKGRRLDPESAELLRAKAIHRPQVQIVVADGLSSAAIEANAPDFLAALVQGLKNVGLSVGTPVFVKYGRVAIMNDIGQILEPDVVVELIGERPGLVTAKSMSCYMCWRPRHGTVESDRSVISNIHDGGTPATEAGASAAAFAKRIYDSQASGTKLSVQ